ncbi:MAG TPA: hypothetical protein VKU80_01875, partial [Planctomycetota bacterium]|nr:hypothetical protein [Planctomycetota bacterium]
MSRISFDSQKGLRRIVLLAGSILLAVLGILLFLRPGASVTAPVRHARESVRAGSEDPRITEPLAKKGPVAEIDPLEAS